MKTQENLNQKMSAAESIRFIGMTFCKNKAIDFVAWEIDQWIKNQKEISNTHHNKDNHC